jgi:hypothetical protein
MPAEKDTSQVPATDAPVKDEGLHDDAVRRLAYEISQSQDAGTPEENWERAERELGSER